MLYSQAKEWVESYLDWFNRVNGDGHELSESEVQDKEALEKLLKLVTITVNKQTKQRENKQNRDKDRYQQYKKDGICCKCHKEKTKFFVTCLSCRRVAAEKMKIRREKKREEELRRLGDSQQNQKTGVLGGDSQGQGTLGNATKDREGDLRNQEGQRNSTERLGICGRGEDSLPVQQGVQDNRDCESNGQHQADGVQRTGKSGTLGV